MSQVVAGLVVTPRAADDGQSAAFHAYRSAERALEAKNPQVLARNIARIGLGPEGAYFADDFCRFAGDANPTVAAAATEALGRLASPELVDVLARQLTHGSATVQCSAAVALGRFGPEAVHCGPLLGDVLGSGAEEAVKGAVIRAIALVGAVDQVDAIVGTAQMLPRLAVGACQALTILGADDRVPEVARLDEMCAALTLEPLSPDLLCAYVAHADWTTRAEALKVLKRTVLSVECMDTLAFLFTSDDAGVRAAAALALGDAGSRRHAGEVAKLLEDDEEDTAWVALQVGGGQGRPSPELRKPKCAALVALGRLRACHEDVASALSDADWEVRISALEAITFTPDHVDQIVDLLEDDIFLVRAAACAALGRLKLESSSLAELFSDPSPVVRVAAITALGTMGSSWALSEAYKLLADSSATVRAATVRVLGESKVGHYASMLGTMLADVDERVRCEAIVALGELGTHGTAFSDEVELCLADASPTVQHTAAEVLALMSAPSQKHMLTSADLATEGGEE